MTDRAHTVLVVDDNPATRYSTSRVLRAAGFRSLEAASGQRGAGAGRRGVSDLMVLDVHLPDIDGFEVCRRLRAAPAHRAHAGHAPVGAFVDDEDKVTASTPAPTAT